MHNTFNNKTVSISLRTLFISVFSSVVLFISVNSYIFYSFKAELDSLNLLINSTKLENAAFVQKLSLENSIQASKIQTLESAIALNSTSNMVSVSQPILDIEVLKLIIICLSVIGILIGSYYYFPIFFQKSVIGKIIGGSSFVKTIIIPFNEQNIELKIEITGNDTYSVTYRYLSEKVFLPFENFLKDHQVLLELFESPDPDLSKIAHNFIQSSSEKAVDVIVTSPEVVLYGEDAFKAVFQL